MTDTWLTLLAVSVAIALAPYSALATVGLGGYLDLVQLPEELSGLAAPFLWVTLAALTLVDALISRHRSADLLWNVLHTLVRPLAAVLFAAAYVTTDARLIQWGAALLAMAVATLVHVSILALRTAAWTAGPVPHFHGFSLLRILLAVAFAVLASAAPPVAAIAGAAIVLAPLPWSAALWGASATAVRSVIALLARPNHPRDWDTGIERLPVRFRRRVRGVLSDSRTPLKSARATLARVGPRWPYWGGRLVVQPDRPVLFVHRRGLRLRILAIGARRARADHAVLIETLEIDEPVPYTLCLGPDAPTGPAILAALAASPHEGGPAEL